MISIKKPKKAPKILHEKGKTETEALCREYSANKSDYENEGKNFEFDSKIYGDKSVKTALVKAQHGKCFLCESKITHVSYGDVEHFRPKGGSRQNDAEEMKKPGYYWLAYAWENLFLACQICNQRFKKNLFPLENPSDRAVSHESDISRERPLFINPEVENPEQLISFRGEIPFAVDGNVRGRITIEATGIDRTELNEMRLEILKPLRVLYELVNLNPQVPESAEALAYLQKCQSDSHQYAAMIRANLRENFRFVID